LFGNFLWIGRTKCGITLFNQTNEEHLFVFFSFHPNKLIKLSYFLFTFYIHFQSDLVVLSRPNQPLDINIQVVQSSLESRTYTQDKTSINFWNTRGWYHRKVTTWMSCFIGMCHNMLMCCRILCSRDTDAEDLFYFCLGFGVELRQKMISQIDHKIA